MICFICCQNGFNYPPEKKNLRGEPDRYDWNRLSCSPSLLRFSVHLLIFFRDIGLYPYHTSESTEEQRENAKTILLSYINYLIDQKFTRLIALYTQLLPNIEEKDKKLRISTYAHFLSSLYDRTQREACLLLAESFGLDVNSIVIQVVDLAKEPPSLPSTQRLSLGFGAAIDEKDQYQIRALEWLCFKEEQRIYMIVYSNSLVRSFILKDKIEAAQSTFELLQQLLPSMSDIMESELDDEINMLRENICLKAYLMCLKQFGTWASHYHQKPNPSQFVKSYTELSFEQLYSSQLEKNQSSRQFNEAEHFWKSKHETLTKNLLDATYKVLYYPNGWLKDRPSAGTYLDPSLMQVTIIGNENNLEIRIQELEALRQKCIPQLIFNLHTVFVQTERYRDSLRLASLVIDPLYEISKCFTKSELRSLLLQLRISGIKMLETEGLKFSATV